MFDNENIMFLEYGYIYHGWSRDHDTFFIYTQKHHGYIMVN